MKPVHGIQEQYFNAANQFFKKRKFESNCDVSFKKKKATIDTNHNTILEQQRNLPIFFGKHPLLTTILNNETTIVMSETGSGKTTQLPQYLLETRLAKNGLICCTQPRRVAAITVADRVAKEKQVKLGSLVGYTVRFEDVTSRETKLKYMTDGMLLRESLLDPLLRRYSVIILDEAHERSIQTDVLFGVVKLAQLQRSNGKYAQLKIVIMSATLQADKFSEYFNNAKICYLEGRRHPIKIKYTEEIMKDYPHASLIAALQIHKEMLPGNDILVFLTGQEEIESITQLIKDISLHLQDKLDKLLVCPLFASLPNSEQTKVFNETPIGYRKIILATNIAETSVTIPGVKYVIDCGMVKAKVYNPSTGLDLLKVQPISKAQARQRCGRAGRECPGICYRLYPENAFTNLDENTVPEIQRCNLKSVVLQLLALGLKDVLKFDFMNPPSADALEDALKQLVLLEAVQSVESQMITEKGKQMSSFPLDPSLASCILAAKGLGCTEEIITIVSLSSVESIVYAPHNQRKKKRKTFQKFISAEGDQITMLLFFRAYKHAKGNADWCREHFVNFKAIKTVVQIRQQLRELCIRLNIPLQSCGSDFGLVRKALVAGLFLNSAERQKDGTYFTIIQKQQVHIHPSSVLFNQKPSFVVFNEVVETSKCYMRDLCVVDPTWLLQASPSSFDEHKLIPKAITS